MGLGLVNIARKKLVSLLFLTMCTGGSLFGKLYWCTYSNVLSGFERLSDSDSVQFVNCH